ncbi:two pore domain potassium channel family protein [Halosimplex rubrum]|uniref:Two pore domain potassium channel family protein n=1 Tax=Halosimplex rubrum TaxID=869889 RepID=A0A7D5PAD5_9EURY|nr:potassium channel family protein [Halosimplex rubrum]QLH78200.1 two pore domain potassium channel family protein [Halosimplex rubrum]
MSLEKKSANGIQPGDIYEELINIIRSEDKRGFVFLGSKLPELRFQFFAHKIPSDPFLNFDFCEIDGKVEITDSNVQNEISFLGADIDEVDISNGQMNGQVKFSSASINKIKCKNTEFDDNFRMLDSVIQEKAIFNGCVFRKKVHMNRTESLSLGFYNCTFGRLTVLADMELSSLSILNCTGSLLSCVQTVVEERHSQRESEFEEVIMEDSELPAQNSFYECKYDRFDFRPKSMGKHVVDLRKSNISSGRLPESNDNGYFAYVCDNATFGDLDLGSSSLYPLLRHFRFNNTEFQGTNFAKYREELSNDGWDLHSFVLDHFRTKSTVESELVRDSEELERLDDLDKSLIYMRAKNASDEIGDQEGASRFLINEMRWLRKHKIRKIRSSNTTRHNSVVDVLTNYLLDTTSRYGEEPIRIVGLSIGTILGCSFLYPLPRIGGISLSNSNSEMIDYSSILGSGDLRQVLLELAEVILESVYFSSITFTTLGYADLQPSNWFSKGLASFESFIGSFLIALFVYSLGKQASR